ncbi:MAG: hypothetical protein ACREFU_05210 [Acetobacteraceae bacterium]
MRCASAIAKEGALPFSVAADPAAHEAWFRARVREAMDDPRPALPQARVEAHFTRRRGANPPAVACET